MRRIKRFHVVEAGPFVHYYSTELCTRQTLGLQRQTICCSIKQCYLPSFICILFEQKLTDKVHAHTHTHDKETNLWGDHHLFCAKTINTQSYICKTRLWETLAGRCCESLTENSGFSSVVPRPDPGRRSVRQAIVRVASKLLAVSDASRRLFSVSFLDFLLVFLNFLVDDF